MGHGGGEGGGGRQAAGGYGDHMNTVHRVGVLGPFVAHSPIVVIVCKGTAVFDAAGGLCGGWGEGVGEAGAGAEYRERGPRLLTRPLLARIRLVCCPQPSPPRSPGSTSADSIGVGATPD